MGFADELPSSRKIFGLRWRYADQAADDGIRRQFFAGQLKNCSSSPDEELIGNQQCEALVSHKRFCAENRVAETLRFSLIGKHDVASASQLLDGAPRLASLGIIAFKVTANLLLAVVDYDADLD